MPSQLSEACRLCKIILSKGYSITVNDGDKDVVFRAKNMTDVRSALHKTDEDYLYVYSADSKNHVGCIYLVYDNMPNGSELICDHSTTPEILSIIEIFDNDQE